MNLSSEYSTKFDELRKNRVETSYYKYGSAKKNFSTGNVNALETMKLCVNKYKKPEIQNFFWTLLTILCLSSCIHNTRKHIFGQQIV